MTVATLHGDFTADDVATQQLVNRTLRARRTQAMLKVVLGIGFPVLLLCLWQALAMGGLIDRRFFPAPTTIGSSVIAFLSNAEQRGELIFHMTATLSRLAVGFGIGATAGVTLGVVMGLNTATRFAVAPLLYGIFPMPKIAIYPLMIVIFGIGDASSAALVTLGVFFMTSINTLSGVLYTNPIYRDISKAFRMPPLTRWGRVIIPSAMPSIITGLRLGLGQALILVISSEFVSAETGVGRFIWDSWQILDIPRMFMGLTVVLLFGGCAALLGNLAERKLIPWAQH
jgi:NitT/TauT family transport system permease protein